MVMKLDKKIRRILRENIIQEGLIKSCDVNKLLNILMTHFSPQDFKINPNFTDDRVNILIFNNTIIDKIEDICFVCGWYGAIKRQENIGVYLQLERKFQTASITSRELVNFNVKYLYHITREHNLKHIKKNGLIPSSKNDQFQYPDRIYFLEKNDKSDVSAMAILLNINRDDDSDTNYILITVDLTKINPYTRFYLDPNTDGTVFTMDNISPQAIVKVDKIDLIQLSDAKKALLQVNDKSKRLPIKNRYKYE